MHNNRDKNKNRPIASKLVIRPSIGSHHILRDDVQHLLIIDHECSIRFSEMQYCALRLLLAGDAVAEEYLLQEVYGEAATMIGHQTLDQLIRKIRNKLRAVGLTILPIEQSGYILVAIPESVM